MDTAALIEIFGYIGSALVVISMLMSSVIKLRVINVIGSVISGIYALIIGSLPLGLMNFCLIAINLFNLHRLLNTRQEYELVEADCKETISAYFLEHYKEDIKKFFPEFDFENEHGDRYNKVFFVFCNGTPVSILLGEQSDDGRLDIALDYSIPFYRDCSIGKYLYPKLGEYGVRLLAFRINESDEHTAYLKKMGFNQENGTFVKRISTFYTKF